VKRLIILEFKYR